VVSGLGLPNHWATNFFLAGLCLELQANAEALSRLQLINQVCGLENLGQALVLILHKQVMLASTAPCTICEDTHVCCSSTSLG
jgi:hypothetical protein